MQTAQLALWLMDRTSAYDLRYSPDQPRDDHGRFGEGDSSGGAQRDEALAQVPTVSRTADERQAVNDYRNPQWFGPINDNLRGDWQKQEDKVSAMPAFLPRGVGGADELRAGAEQRTAALDSLMSRSQLSGDIETYRGVQNATAMFGSDRLGGDLTGMQWKEEAYVSTSVRMETAREFANPNSSGVLMRMTAPEGTGAIQISGMSGEGEVMLDRGLSMTVTADHGYDPDWGFRVLDVAVGK